MRYEVSFSGTAYVEADSASEANKKFFNEDFETKDTDIDCIREDTCEHM